MAPSDGSDLHERTIGGFGVGGAPGGDKEKAYANAGLSKISDRRIGALEPVVEVAHATAREGAMAVVGEKMATE